MEIALLLPTALPPGNEELALAALTFAFQSSAVRKLFSAASDALVPYQSRKPKSHLLLASAEQASKKLLEGYAAAGLGLVPEEGPRGSPAGRRFGSQWSVLQGLGSLLPLRVEWLFCGVSLPNNHFYSFCHSLFSVSFSL